MQGTPGATRLQPCPAEAGTALAAQGQPTAPQWRCSAGGLPPGLENEFPRLLTGTVGPAAAQARLGLCPLDTEELQSIDMRARGALRFVM